VPDTAVDRRTLEQVLDGLGRTPDGFVVHPKLVGQLARRRERFEGDTIDWALAEALAFGSLAVQGTRVRLSGEDSGRGTFSQRHATLFDHETAEPFTPLARIADDQAPFQVFDSLLSEFAVLGFEYGYSVGDPSALVLWEAQFGDFVNGAQVIIDQFLAGAEDKWGQRSGVTLLLPHGYEGQGPEHSSARLERFLQLAAGPNLRVASPGTPAQYFHLLRDQAFRRPRSPLVVMTPKGLLRHKACVSTRDEHSSGRFLDLVDDPRAPQPESVQRLLLCSGKVYYDLDAERERNGANDLAICRVDLLHPFPDEAVRALLERYGAVRDLVWVQEEPRNMGAWNFVRERLEAAMREEHLLTFVGRSAAASTATGSHRRHLAEQAALVQEALGVKLEA
jgi:2-oxoglutarate dehydrogenase E1 component